jgi:hypothetical protein
MKALEAATSLKILWPDFRAINSWAERVALHLRSLGQNSPQNHLEKLTAYQYHIINLQKT